MTVQEKREANGLKVKFDEVVKSAEKKETEEEKTRDYEDAVKALDIEAKEWEKRQNKTNSELLKETYGLNKERAEFEADRIRMKLLEKKPESTKTIDAIHKETNNNPEVAFEKYKDFVKRNFIGISGLLITIRGVVATIVLAFRNTAKSGGNSTQKAGNEVKNPYQELLEIFQEVFSRTREKLFLGLETI